MPVQTWPSYHMMTSPPYILPIPQPIPPASPLLPSVPVPPPPTPPVSTAVHVPPIPLWTSTTSPLFSLANVFSLAVMSVAQSLLPAVSVVPAQTGPLYTSPVPQSPVLCPPSPTTTSFVYPDVASPIKPAQIANGMFEMPLFPGGQLSPSTPTTGTLENSMVSLTEHECMAVLRRAREQKIIASLPSHPQSCIEMPFISMGPKSTFLLIHSSQIPRYKYDSSLFSYKCFVNGSFLEKEADS